MDKERLMELESEYDSAIWRVDVALKLLQAGEWRLAFEHLEKAQDCLKEVLYV